MLTVEPLAVRAFEGLTTLRGRADFTDPENPVFKFSANARGLRWGEDAQTQISANADLGFAGRMKAWAAIGKATLEREKQKATVDFDGRGDGEQLVLHKLQAKMPTGTLDATGTVGWEPALRWDLGAKLAGFDPGYFLAGW